MKHTDSIYLDAINMRFKNVVLNGKSIAYKNDGKKLIIYHQFEEHRSHTLNFIFFASPKKAMYFVGWDNEAPNQIWTQGQGKYTSNWLPSIDDMNDKIEFDLTFAAPKGYQVVSNGKLISKRESSIYNLWEFDMKKPMSSYLVAVVIGKYNKITKKSKSGISLEMYYYPRDTNKIEPTYRYSKQMFDYLETEIGVAYPWQNYKQIPVHDFLYAGMENTSATIFSDDFMIDEMSFVDKNYVNVNAHELAHQWFGNLVTEVSGKHHWLQEGFATYYALLAERKAFGADHFYWRLHEYAQELINQERAGQGTSLLNPKSSSTTFYKKGAWTLFMLREKIGDVAYRSAVKNYLEKHQFENVETKDFISQAEMTSGEDLTAFAEVWLEDDVFPIDRALDALKQNSSFIEEYLMVDCEAFSSKCKNYLTSGISYQAKEKIIEQNPGLISVDVFDEGLKTRQAIAKHLTKIPRELKVKYETLLNDRSYVTIENALVNLWVNFPEDRSEYLNKTKNISGFNNKNIKMLWLTLTLLTPDYLKDKNIEFLNELSSFTSEEYNFEIRMSAFNFLQNLDIFKDEVLQNLKDASQHYNWQLEKFSKNLLELLQENPKYKAALKRL